MTGVNTFARRGKSRWSWTHVAAAPGLRWVGFASLLVVACADPGHADTDTRDSAETPHVVPDVQTDVQTGVETDVPSEVEIDATETSSPAPDTELVLGRRYAVTVSASSRDTPLPVDPLVSGELIATYDQRGWWTPGEDTLLAFFDPESFPERPEDWANDRSIRIVARRDITHIAALPDRSPTFSEFARLHHLWPAVPLDGPTYVMAGNERHHLAEDGFGDFAYDLGRADESGRWRGDGLDLSDYLSWDVPIYAPRSGLVIELVDEHPDRPIGRPIDPYEEPSPAEFLELPENLVGLWLTGRYYLYLLHLRENSLPSELAPGDVVTAGAPLGTIGNSGTSLEPHLHLVLLFWDSERERTFSVPLAFTDVFVSDRPGGAQHRDAATPLGGNWVANTPF